MPRAPQRWRLGRLTIITSVARAAPDGYTLLMASTELFKQKTGTSFLAIPYKSSGESVKRANIQPE